MLDVTFIKTMKKKKIVGKNKKQRKRNEKGEGREGKKRKVKKGTLVMKLQYLMLHSLQLQYCLLQLFI